MANIADKVAQIRQAIFGKDVRESIASGIEAINTEVVNTTTRQNVIDGQEQSRINNENIRKSNETTRQIRENTRQTNETTRQSQENIRQTNETIRQTTFESNEVSRQNVFNTNEDDRKSQFNVLKTDLIDSIESAEQATLNTNTATANYMDIVEQTKKIYKPIVNSYSDISTTYSNPEIGWTTVTKDTHIEYRWDGVEWVDIGVSDLFDGYNIVVGSTPPNNPNLIWLDSPESTTYSRIIPSYTEPTDTSQIWWEQD